MPGTDPTDPISRMLAAVQARFAADQRGAVADYIPELSLADPDRFGIALVSLEGRVYSAGDADTAFTIQSVSKPFVYALALADHGLEAVLARVGAEPSGEAFNAISLEPGTGRPANPMVNAGAIVTTSFVEAANPDERFLRIQAILSDFAGRPLNVDEAVYRSEQETGDMNRALGYLMRNAGSLRGDVDAALDVYFRQCAVNVTARDLAVMAATLANGGVNPVTGRAVISESVASHVLTVMGTCGMYDGSGEWLLRVGLPAKSGVSGALLAAKPAQFGLGLWSPRLDAQGNSVRAAEACRALTERFGLHLMNHPGRATPATYLDLTGADLRSPAPRSDDELAWLDQQGDALLIRGMQGDIGFAAAEQLYWSFSGVGRSENPGRWLVLDLTRVGRVHRAAHALLEATVSELAAAGVTVTVVDPGARELLQDVQSFTDQNTALQWCEDQLLATR